MDKSDVMLKQRPSEKSLPKFFPVIFANGSDDDSPGLQALANDEDVMFDGRVYTITDPINIFGRRLFLTRPVYFVCTLREVCIEDCLVYVR